MECRRLSDVELAVSVGGRAVSGGLASMMLTRADWLDVRAHPGAILRVLLIVLGVWAMRSSAGTIGLTLARNVQASLLQILLHVDRLSLQRTVARGS